MKQILEQWSGTFEYDDKEHQTLDELEVVDGEEFHVRLIPRKEKNVR